MPPTPTDRSLHFTRRDALRTLALTVGASAIPGILGTLTVKGASPSPSASAGASAPPVVRTSLGGKLDLLRGLGGNIAVLGGDDGVLAIDSGLVEVASKTAGEIGQGGAVALLVNTHWHYDHTGGNELLAKAGARIIAHENCRKRLAVDQFVEAMARKVPASPPVALPRVTFASETTLHVNGEEIRLVPVPPAHTDGDVIVVFAQADLIHAGDLYFNGMYPFIDYSSGGWIGGMAAAIGTLSGMANAKTRIIPGHGPVASWEDLKGYLAFLETVHERLGKLKEQGKTIEEVMNAAPLKDFDEKLGQGFLKPEQFLRIVYTGLLKHG